jgi:hypothetical protein
MLIGLGYLVLVIVIACGPFHAAGAAEGFPGDPGRLPWWGYAGLPIALGIAGVATVLPMQVGARTLRRMEF